MASPFRDIDPDASRRPVNVSLNSGLFAGARAGNLNPSAIAEAAICRAVSARPAWRFRQEIVRSIAELSAYLTEFGSFSEPVRQMREGDDGW